MSGVNSRRVQITRYLWRLREVGLLIGSVAVLGVLFVLVFRFIMPFVIGWFIAVLLLPLIRNLEHRGVNRLLAILTVMGTVLVSLLLMCIYAAVSLFREATLLSANAGQYMSVVDTWAQQQIALSQDFFGTLPKRISLQLQNSVTGALTSVETMFRSILSGLIHSITHLPETLFILVIAVITAFFVLLQREAMYQRFQRLLPPGWSAKMQGVTQDITRAFVGTVRVQLVLMLLSCVLGAIGMFVIGVPYAVLLGILFGVAGAVPILGSALVTVPWAIGALLMGDVPLAIKLLLLQVVISIIRHMVEPKILAENVGLGILSTLFGLYVGMRVLGVIGLFLGPIIVIALKSLFRAHMFSDFFPADAEEQEENGSS